MCSRRISVNLGSLLRGAVIAGAAASAGCLLTSSQALAGCEFHARAGTITRVVHIALDNVHADRDDPNLLSDLEQMPHLRDFFTQGGTLDSNLAASPLGQRIPDLLTVLTGLYGDRMGVPLGDSFGSFQSDGSVTWSLASGYWTTRSGDGRPLMLSEAGKTAPAPWVPFTRAGCNVGAVATAGLALQARDPDAARDASVARTDLPDIAIHCARGSTLCGSASARPDLLPDEAGGYAGYSALFGHSDALPLISPGRAITGLDSNDIADGSGHPELPDAPPTASQSLGYAAAMLEAGVDVVYASIGNAHAGVGRTRPFGPGEPGHVARLAADDAAFDAFIGRLDAHGINRQNTLFVAVSTGADRFAPTGGIVAAIDRLLATERNNVTALTLQDNTTPAFYIRGNPGQSDPLTRMLAQDVGKLTALNPLSNKSERLAAMLADRAQLRIMHMITASPDRAPHFLMFGDPNYIYRASDSHAGCATTPACVAIDADITWLRGDLRPGNRGWFGMAGPGVAGLGQADTPSHHVDLRPTMLALLGLRDSYVHDGVVLADIIDRHALPPQVAAAGDIYRALTLAYANLNAPFGQFGHAGLALSNQAIRAGDTSYRQYLDAISSISTRRDALAQDMKTQFDSAAFDDRPLSGARAAASISRAETLISDVEELAARSLGSSDRPWKAASDAR